VATILTIFPENKLTTMANLVPSKRKLVVWRILGGGPLVYATAVSWFILLCRIHFPWLFPDFPGKNESFSPTNLFMQNTNVGFQSRAIALKTKAAEQI